jgi:tetratricopeptide (TPR) repeat protein
LNEEKQGFRMLERALLLSPKNLPLLMFIAENYFRSDKFELAKDYLEQAQKISPKNKKIWLILGVIFADEGEFEKAGKLLKPLASNKANSFCANYVLGMISAAEKDWNASLAHFKAAAEAKDSVEINYLVGCVYFQLHRYKLAGRFMRKALETNAGFADSWFMLSVIYEHLNQSEQAAEMRQQALLSKETGAQSLEFLKQRTPEKLTAALPFLRLSALKTRLLTGGSKRLTKMFREELFECLDQ